MRPLPTSRLFPARGRTRCLIRSKNMINLPSLPASLDGQLRGTSQLPCSRGEIGGVIVSKGELPSGLCEALDWHRRKQKTVNHWLLLSGYFKEASSRQLV
jgi:hypothetical protein